MKGNDFGWPVGWLMWALSEFPVSWASISWQNKAKSATINLPIHINPYLIWTNRKANKSGLAGSTMPQCLFLNSETVCAILGKLYLAHSPCLTTTKCGGSTLQLPISKRSWWCLYWQTQLSASDKIVFASIHHRWFFFKKNQQMNVKCPHLICFLGYVLVYSEHARLLKESRFEGLSKKRSVHLAS